MGARSKGERAARRDQRASFARWVIKSAIPRATLPSRWSSLTAAVFVTCDPGAVPAPADGSAAFPRLMGYSIGSIDTGEQIAAYSRRFS